MADSASNPVGDILEPQGKHHGWWSLKPLTEAAEFAKTPGPYFKKSQEANGGAPVYKIHPGLASIALTDHASAKWFFEQPETVLDRQDGRYFGALNLTEEYVGDTMPALVSNMKESHAVIRQYTIAAFRERLEATQTALTHASDNFYRDLKANGLGEHTKVYETLIRNIRGFMFEWVFGLGEEGGEPLPPFADFLTANPTDVSVLIKLEIDTPIANAMAFVSQAAAGGVSSAQKKSVEVVLDSIRASKMFPKYLELFKKNNVPVKSLERSLMFTASFQSSTAMSKNMEVVISALTLDPIFADELRKEVDGQELTMDAVNDVSRFPLLDSLHWEVLRMSHAPPFYFKGAKVDAVIPTSSGQRYQVRKGDMLCCHQVLAQMDQTKFGPDAKEFNMRRFVGNPELKKYVFAYGYADQDNVGPRDGMPWGCAARAMGVVDGIMKYIYARWVQEATWELTATPVMDPDLFLGTVGPTGVEFASVTPRK